MRYFNGRAIASAGKSARAARMALAAVLLLAGCFGGAKAPVAPPLEGSTWRGVDSDGDFMEWTFLPGGAVFYRTPSGDWSNGSWRLEGGKVLWQCNNHFSDYEATMEGAEMNGEAKNTTGKTWTFHMKRLPPKTDRVAAPPIIPAAEWGSQPDTDAMLSRRHLPARITLHHAGVIWKAGEDPVKKVQGLQSWGRKEKGWPDVPYHFLIAPDGRIFEGRALQFVPETNTTYNTTGHVGIQLWGNFEEQRATPGQLRSTVWLTAWLCQELRIDPETIRGHRDHAETACPGLDFYRYIEQGLIRRWVTEMLLSGQAPRVEPLPPLPGGPTEWTPAQ